MLSRQDGGACCQRLVMQLEFYAAVLIGLAGGVHCVGMCGGVIAGLSFAIPRSERPDYYVMAYSLGRISSYTVAGALTGYLGSLFSHHVTMGMVWLNLLSGSFLLLIACYIAGWWRILTKLEKMGGIAWRRLHPIAARLIPFKSWLHAFPYGLIWGWLPCGLVYSALTWSLASESATQGALVMFGFGVGTLPATLILSYASHSLKAWLQNNHTKQVIAVVIAIFAIQQLAQAVALIR